MPASLFYVNKRLFTSMQSTPSNGTPLHPSNLNRTARIQATSLHIRMYSMQINWIVRGKSIAHMQSDECINPREATFVQYNLRTGQRKRKLSLIALFWFGVFCFHPLSDVPIHGVYYTHKWSMERKKYCNNRFNWWQQSAGMRLSSFNLLQSLFSWRKPIWLCSADKYVTYQNAGDVWIEHQCGTESNRMW